MAKRPKSGDDAEDKITTDEGASIPQDHSVAVLEETDQATPHLKKRRIQRLEEVAFTQEERIAIENEIIEANGSLRSIEDTKKIQDKAWNGQIAEYEATMNDAIDVLRKGTFTIDVERIEEMNYDSGMVFYFNVDTGEEVDSRDMTEEEKQTRMDM